MIGKGHERATVPDFIHPIVGVRGWYIQDGQLVSPSYDEPWEREQEAWCNPAGYTISFPHEAPHTYCSCGLYAFHHPRTLDLNYPHVPVAGIVQAWGTCEIHDHGLRSQYMRICALSPRLQISLNPLAGLDMPILRQAIAAGALVMVFALVLGVMLGSLVSGEDRPITMVLLYMRDVLAYTLVMTGGALLVLCGWVTGYRWYKRRAFRQECEQLAQRYEVPLIPYDQLELHMHTWGQPTPKSTRPIAGNDASQPM